MGNLCSKSANKPDPFSTPGRTLNSAPPPQPANPRAQIPSNAAQGRTLGSGSRGKPPSAAPQAGGDARSAAAKAAEERAAASKSSAQRGKLGRDLAIQKGQSRTNTLEEMSKEERRRRELDDVGKARDWN